MLDLAAILQAVARDADAVIYVKDAEHRFLYLSPYGVEQTDAQSLDDILGKTAREYLDDDAVDVIEQSEDQVRESGKPITLDQTLKFPVGPARRCINHKFPIDIPGHPGAIAGIALFFDA